MGLAFHKHIHIPILAHSPRLSLYAVSNYDPTHTTTLRNQFARAMAIRFRELRGVIRKAIVDEDCFALQKGSGGFAVQAGMTTPGRLAFDFPRSGDKISAFMSWLRKQENVFLESGGVSGIGRTVIPQLGAGIETAWTDQYIQSAYQKGIVRARQELIGAGYPVPSIEASGGIGAVFNTPMHLNRVGVLYTRTFNDLKGITNAMDMQISRVLAQGMADGKNPVQLARLLTRTISGPVGDLGITDTLGRFIPAERRAKVLARTEIIRAHHSATMQEYKNWEVEEVKVKAEWQTAGDARVCEECSALEGRVYSLEEIGNMIPLHPQCRCVALPVDITGKEE